MAAFREVHSLRQGSDRLSTQISLKQGRIEFGGVFFYHNAAIVDQSGSWYKSVVYPEDRKQGLDFEEDLYAPFRLVCPFVKGRDNFFCVSLEDRKMVNPRALILREDERRYQFAQLGKRQTAA